ncbi:hypothetical protein [Actinomadura sp. 9N407]|uniref:hypothetical protein n=1 Tax=Actinomadura sp. 9N407 TaxID=3375154 RepID=UPI003794F24B
MTESPPRPADEDAPLVPPPAPPPAAPWWASSSVEVTGPRPTVVDPIPVQPVPDPGHLSVATGPQPQIGGWAPAPPLPQPGPSDTSRPKQGRSEQGRSRSGLVAGLAIGAGVLATAAVAGLIAVTGGEDVPVRKVSASATAGGLHKGAAVPAASAAYPFIAAAVRAGGVEQAATATAIYRGTGEQSILFIGGAAPIGDPAAFLGKAHPSTVIKTAPTTPIKGAGRLSCGTFAVLAATHLYCAWATENSFGFVASNTPATGDRLDGLATLTGRMRADLEKIPS